MVIPAIRWSSITDEALNSLNSLKSIKASLTSNFAFNRIESDASNIRQIIWIQILRLEFSGLNSHSSRINNHFSMIVYCQFGVQSLAYFPRCLLAYRRYWTIKDQYQFWSSRFGECKPCRSKVIQIALSSSAVLELWIGCRQVNTLWEYYNLWVRHHRENGILCGATGRQYSTDLKHRLVAAVCRAIIDWYLKLDTMFFWLFVQ